MSNKKQVGNMSTNVPICQQFLGTTKYTNMDDFKTAFENTSNQVMNDLGTTMQTCLAECVGDGTDPNRMASDACVQCIQQHSTPELASQYKNMADCSNCLVQAYSDPTNTSAVRQGILNCTGIDIGDAPSPSPTPTPPSPSPTPSRTCCLKRTLLLIGFLGLAFYIVLALVIIFKK
jgi:hypothetical protein